MIQQSAGCSSLAVWFIFWRDTSIYFCEIALELAVSCQETATVNFQKKGSIAFQIDQAHSAKLASLLNVIDQFMLHFGQPSLSLPYSKTNMCSIVLEIILLHRPTRLRHYKPFISAENLQCSDRTFCISL